MARTRIIYQSESVKVDGVTAIGVQSCSYGLDVTREDVLQFGDLGAVDRIILEAPVANMEVSMYINGLAGSHLNTIVQKGISGTAIDCVVSLGAEGDDYATALSSVGVVSGSVTSLSAEASVGAIPTLTLGFEGTDLSYSPTAAGVPTTDIDVATQSGVVVKMDQVTGTFTGHYVHPQSCSVSFDLGVEGLQELSYETSLGLASAGNKFQYARVPSYPASASMELEAFAIDKGMTMSLAGLQQKASEGNAGGANEGGKINVGVDMGGTTFSLVNATLDSVSFSSSVGDTAATCNATFGVSIGGPNSDSTLVIAGTTGPS
jgi:hypothetical protein|tara:strand:+ start:2581 stop:3537 length:957 start_codon:yes stop_codon:yes gene_type:complete